MNKIITLIVLILGIIFVSGCVKTDIGLTNCKTYYNGCNTCPVENGEIKNNYYTQRYCPLDTIEEPRCIKWVNEECDSDNDCKLIYNNCDCEVILRSDQRTSLENDNTVCIWNICRGTNVTAICRDNKCVRSDNTRYLVPY